MKKIVGYFTLIVFFFSCMPATKITGSWKNTKQPAKNYANIFIASLSSNSVARSTVETDMAAAFEKENIKTYKGMDEFPPGIQKDSLSKEEVLDKAKNKNADAILTITLIRKETQSRYVPGDYLYEPLPRYAYYCGSPVLTGPMAPPLGSAECYTVFSTDGAVSNSGITYITGDVGTNNGSATNFNPLFVTGTIHPIPDASTAQCAADLLVAYNYVNTLSYDIELLYPAQFGRNLVLTPHTYFMNAAATFTDTLYLNACGNANAVFIIQINGALSTSTYSNVILINGAQAKNVYWKIEGAVSINNYSVFCGTIICNNGALGALNTGVMLKGRALTTTGAITTTAMNAVATMTPGNCSATRVSYIDDLKAKDAVVVYPNPFSTSTTIRINDVSQIKNCTLSIYNVLGAEVVSAIITKQVTTLSTSTIPSGIYFYKVISNNKVIQSGKMIAE